jgi:hypothetical protein
MICAPCRHAGEAFARGEAAHAAALHDRCIVANGSPTTRCDCQHRTDQDYVNHERIKKEPE